MVTGISRSRAAARVIAAASGSWNTLNSATAVTLPEVAEPPMKTIRSMPAATSGWPRSSSAMFVCGAVATRVIGSSLPMAASNSCRSSSTADNGERRRSDCRENPPNPSDPWKCPVSGTGASSGAPAPRPTGMSPAPAASST